MLSWALIFLVVALIAGASLLLGNIGALAQLNVRRLLAYSAIGQQDVRATPLQMALIAATISGPTAAPFRYGRSCVFSRISP